MMFALCQHFNYYKFLLKMVFQQEKYIMGFKRVDANQAEIMRALRDRFGARITVRSIAAEGNGLPDLLIGVLDCFGDGHTILLEVKDGNKPPSKQALTTMEKSFHKTWTGGGLFVVNSKEMAINAVLVHLERKIRG